MSDETPVSGSRIDRVSRPNLTIVTGESAERRTADDVLHEVADLIATRLPSIPFHDPDRGVLAALGCVRRPSVRGALGVRPDG